MILPVDYSRRASVKWSIFEAQGKYSKPVGVAQPREETMKTMNQIMVAVSLVVISAMAPKVEAQQGVEKAAAGTLVAPAEALNSLLRAR